MTEALQALATILQEHGVDTARLHWQEPMSKHTSFRIGGPAQLLYTGRRVELPFVLKACMEMELPLHVMGNGTNLLVRDGGVDGLMLQVAAQCNDVQINGRTIYAEAGAMLPHVARMACSEGLSGLEFACGIPGTLGGAVVMNAGAYGGQMDMVVTTVWALDRDGNEHCFQNGEIGFAYRHSMFLNQPWIVTRVEMTLAEGDKASILSRVDQFTKERLAKQPLDKFSAGSTFKRPLGYFAAPMIEQAGFKGMRLGGAQVSDMHAGFLVNADNATARDMLALIGMVQRRVYGLYRVRLEPEVQIWGKD